MRVVWFKWSTRLVWKRRCLSRIQKKVQEQRKWTFVEREFLEGGTNEKAMRQSYTIKMDIKEAKTPRMELVRTEARQKERYCIVE